jgi:hypothetical protein
LRRRPGGTEKGQRGLGEAAATYRALHGAAAMLVSGCRYWPQGAPTAWSGGGLGVGAEQAGFGIGKVALAQNSRTRGWAWRRLGRGMFGNRW